MRNNREGLLIVLSGPSGSGKDTLLSELAAHADDDLEFSVSLTTRQRRSWEADGTHYYFVTREYFEQKLKDGEVLEHTSYSGNYYGTPKTTVDEWLANGKTVVLKIEVEGAKRIRSLYPNCVSVFLLPPSLEVLSQRLFGRKSEDESEILRRMEIAADELRHASDYDYLILNDELDYAVSDFRAIIRAERQRTCRRKYMIEEVTKIQ
ncbi:MAG: guanylate kinase [Oscillospiraceae bacterium]|jgi:guanylate kinase|nr:guanylate kinase [Oscillospiraceae bacterium]